VPSYILRRSIKLWRERRQVGSARLENVNAKIWAVTLDIQVLKGLIGTVPVRHVSQFRM
jgi:hypothetical protein